MKLTIKKDEFLDIIGFGDKSGVETTNSALDTTVLVKNGDTIVIGGIFKQSRTTQEDDVPGLAKIPLLGYLFKHDKEVTSDSEVMIFLSPKIVDLEAVQ